MSASFTAYESTPTPIDALTLKMMQILGISGNVSVAPITFDTEDAYMPEAVNVPHAIEAHVRNLDISLEISMETLSI